MNAGALNLGPPPADAKRQIERLSIALKAALAGKHPAVQGAVLAELTATCLAGHLPAEVREELLELQVAAIRELIPFSEAEIHESQQ